MVPIAAARSATIAALFRDPLTANPEANVNELLSGGASRALLSYPVDDGHPPATLGPHLRGPGGEGRPALPTGEAMRSTASSTPRTLSSIGGMR